MSFLKPFKALFFRYPLECFFTLALTLPIFFLPNEPIFFLPNETLENSYFLSCLVAPLAFITLYRLHALHRVTYYLGALILLIIIAWVASSHTNLWTHPSLRVCYPIALWVLLSKDWHKQNPSYIQQFLYTLIHLSLAGIATLILFVACLITLLTIQTLFLHTAFSLSIISDRLALFSMLAIFPFFFLYFEDKSQPNPSLSRFTKTIIRFILNPAILIYTAILYVYIGRILITGDMPSNQVVFLVLPYLFTGLIIQSFHDLAPDTPSKTLNIFRYLVLAPIALVWVALSIRIVHYGLTPARIESYTFIGFITLYYVINLFREKIQYRHFAALVIAVLVFLGIYPPTKIAQQNQLARFEKHMQALHLVDHDHQPVHNFEDVFQKIAPNSPQSQQLILASDALDYLMSAEKEIYNEIQQRFGQARLDRISQYALRNYTANEHGKERDNNDYQPIFSSEDLYIHYEAQHFKRFISLKDIPSRVITPSDNTSDPSFDKQIEFTFPHHVTRRLSIPYAQHIADVFAKHQLDIKKAYPTAALTPLTDDLLVIETPHYILVLDQLYLTYSKDKGYHLKYLPSPLFLLEKK